MAGCRSTSSGKPARRQKACGCPIRAWRRIARAAKLRRLETGAEHIGAERDELRKKLGNELADAFAYMSNIANHYDIDLAEAVRGKFNEVSDKYGFPERI